MQTSIEKDQTWRSFNTFLITIGTLFPAILMFTVSQLSPDQKYIIIGLITIGYALCEVTWMGGFSFAFMDMAPDYVGIIQGINNTIGLMPGFIVPVVISNLTPGVR
jgi:hypothetical protein